MTKKINLKKALNHINDDDLFGMFIGFKGNNEESIKPNLDSIKKALTLYDKIFLELGIFYHEDEFAEEGTFSINNEKSIEVEYDSYYNRYDYHVAGFGVYITEKEEIEYGYYTTEAPPSGHGTGYTTFHDFKDAAKDDEVKNEIFKFLDELDIWE